MLPRRESFWCRTPSPAAILQLPSGLQPWCWQPRKTGNNELEKKATLCFLEGSKTLTRKNINGRASHRLRPDFSCCNPEP